MKQDTPDLMGQMPRKRGPGRPRREKPKTAEEIARSMEAEGRKWLQMAKVVRGKAK